MLQFIHWGVNPNAIENLGPLTIQWYGLLWGAGLMAVFYIGRYILRTLNRDEEKLTILIQYVFIAGLIGARLVHVVFYDLDRYLDNPIKILAVWEGGLASHGGVIGGIIGMLLFCRRNPDYGILWTLDHAAIPSLTLASLIRLGNLFNSELVGKPADVPWAFIFTRVDNIPRHPVVLYESIAYFIIQLIQLYLFRKYKDSKPGVYMGVFFLLLFGVRFMLECYKVPDGDLILGISKTQWLNVPFIIAGIITLYLALGNKLKYNNKPSV